MPKTNSAAPACKIQRQAMIADLPLDQDAPCGLFETSRGDRYLITYDEDEKIAIVLHHPNRRAFTCRRLSQRQIACGTWLGNCELELTHRATKVRANRIGTLGIDEFSASLHCHSQRASSCWKALGHIPFSDPSADYNGWRLLHGGRVFFEQTPRCANWPKILPMRFDHRI